MTKFLILICFLVFSLTSFSQKNEKLADDFARISLNVHVPDQIEPITPIVQSALENRLSQIVSKYGIADNGLNKRFTIVPRITITDKSITSTAPAMHVMVMEVSFFIGDGVDGKLFSSYSISSKGVGENETKAYMAALKNIKTTDPKFELFISEGKKKILEYYNSQCDFMLKDAKTLSAKSEYEEALSLLSSIPQVCSSCYERANDLTGIIYRKKIDYECTKLYDEANSIWSAKQDENGANEAARLLIQIDPLSSCFTVAKNLLERIRNDIKQRIRELDQREWEYRMQEQQNTADLNKEIVRAAAKVAVAHAKSKPSTVIVYNRFWY
jgi:hypothetical protein